MNKTPESPPKLGRCHMSHVMSSVYGIRSQAPTTLGLMQLGSIKSPSQEGLITGSRFHHGSADFWTNIFIVLHELIFEVNIIDKICLLMAS